MDNVEKDQLLLDAWTATLAAQQSVEMIEFLCGRIQEVTRLAVDGGCSKGGGLFAASTVAAGLFTALLEQVETTHLLSQLVSRKAEYLEGSAGPWHSTTVEVADMAQSFSAAAAAVKDRATHAMRSRVGLDENTGPAHFAAHGPLQRG